MGSLIRFLPAPFVEWRYFEAGKGLAAMVNSLPSGGDSNYEELLSVLGKWEKEYARRGFKPVPIEVFVGFGGERDKLKDALGQRREEGENPIFYVKAD